MKTLTKNYGFTAAVLCVTVILWMLSAFSRAGVIYSNGFEPGDPGTADFYDSTTNTQGADITVVPSGGGTLQLTAPQGTHYAEITNVHDTYNFGQVGPSGYGESVYTDYGAPTGIPISGPFYESTAYYINTAWPAASANNNFAGFWIDTTPNNDPGYKDETNFRIIDTGSGQIGVQMVGLNGTGAATITTSGWYTFKTTFEDDGSGNVLNNMSIIDSLGNTLGSYAADSSLPVADLVGTNYGDWTTVWQNGFAGDVLGIDDVQVGTVPEPASMGLICVGGAAILMRRKRRAV
jgi:hypothetical protein